MTKLQKIQQISGLLRLVVIAIGAAILAILAAGKLLYDQWWLSVSIPLFNELWDSGDISQTVLSLSVAPFIAAGVLGIYWLQRLFAVYQRGEFFGRASMNCYLWLLWLKGGSYLYGLMLPVLLGSLSGRNGEIFVDIGDLLTLILLMVILHLLKAAQDIDAENREFV